MRRHAEALETVSVEVPEAALEAFESALSVACGAVSFFLEDEDRRIWRLEGVRPVAAEDGALQAALALASFATGVSPALVRRGTEASGWLERVAASFPDQLVGERFLVRGSHSKSGDIGRIVLTLDAGVAFGSGEHGSTRGCLRALEMVARRRPRRVLDLGTGSGILAIAAAQLMRRSVLATDVDPRSVRVARENAAANGVGRMVRTVVADGWRSPALAGSFDLVLANILARPLCAMAKDLARHLAPGGTVILAGLLDTQARQVLAAHRRHGIVLESTIREGRWTTLVLRRR